ncbi:COX15/CtaA family protein [Arenicella sp. 4NH20-0111]|uniref:COX15/CtaA family protein n=1 Tax=Arenicella sp. 4NH20-0111 TaxID=3127648 RepID=UPI003341D188
MNQNSEYQHSLILGGWLLFCAAVVYLMVVVGGVTRLTQSGLSMVEWSPIVGIIPPLNEAEWLAVFEKYRQSPEYIKVNAGMSLEGFKQIFYWEYGHRVLGRIIGMIYFFPLLYFVIKGMVPREWYGRLFGLFVLGGLQGVMGWYMVKSGLVDVPHVSQYRLTAHLGLALVIFACMFWYSLDFIRGERRHKRATSEYLLSTGLVVFIVFVMMLSGGFVAGTKAGFIMNTFPKMAGSWVPEGLLAMEPVWKNLFENPVAIQFIHRCTALLVVLAVLWSVLTALKQTFKTGVQWLLVIVVCQIALGISALVLRVPVWLGALHQAGAVALLAAALYSAHKARKGAQYEY